MARVVSTGPNARPLDDTVAETGPGIPDDAVTPGELGPTDLDTDAVAASAKALAAKGWAPADPDAVSQDEAEAESEAHPT